MAEQLGDGDLLSRLPSKLRIRIFSYISIRDRVKLLRVCKNWLGEVRDDAWDLKTLDFKETDWGYKYWEGEGVNLNVLTKVLDLCGKKLLRIDFSQHYEDPEHSYVQSLKANRTFFAIIKSRCPVLRSINIKGLAVTVEGLKYLGRYYRELTEFSIDGYYDAEAVKFSEPLSLFFHNNRNLGRIELYVKTDGRCLLELNPIAVEEISVMCGLGGEANICEALETFISLSSFSVTDWAENATGKDDLIKMLRAIGTHSEKLRSLEIITMALCHLELGSENFRSFVNLQKLSLEGVGLRIDLIDITKHCTRLTCVKLKDLLVTDSQLASILQLPQLEELRLCCLKRITDAAFINQVSPLKIVGCASCPKLTNAGFRSLLLNSSQTLEKLEISSCENHVALRKLIRDAKRATRTRSAGPLLKMNVEKKGQHQVRKVTKLSPYLELTQMLHEMSLQKKSKKTTT